ncbi:MAG: hypothetical protein QM706_09245 [Nitrospira sp.]
MTAHRSPLHTPVCVSLNRDRDRTYRAHRYATVGFFLIVLFSILTPSVAMAEGTVSPLLLADIVNQRADQLASVDSDEAAMKLFTTTVGPALGLKDAIGTLRTKGIPSKMAKELRLAELSQSVHELMAALATWQFADSIRRNIGQSPALPSLSAARQEWLRGRSRTASLSDLLRLAQDEQAHETSQTTSSSKNTDSLLAAEHTVFESSQLATAAWWDIYGWKERVRQAKGRARLCGTWHWTIHNHQHHEEQKHTVVFSPDGQEPANIPGLSEMILLGDNIYLRWEHNGQIQEDSLQFIKDNTKIEGSFINSLGGWGAISGKRTAACKP